MDLANKLPKIKDQEKESKFGYVFAVSGPGVYRDQIIKYSEAHLICVEIYQLFLYCVMLYIKQHYSCLSAYFLVVTAENMSGAAMYELVSRNGKLIIN